MIENRISGHLYNERFSESKEEKCTAFESMVWSLIVHKNTIKNCSAALQAFSFRSLSLFISFISFFHKGKDTYEIPQPSVQHLVYVFPFPFVFIKALITST